MNREQIKERVAWLKNQLANSRSECPMDYADWLGELQELEKRAKGGTK